jgi:hypothetical protein
MNGHEWPEYTIDSCGVPHRLLKRGEILRDDDRCCLSWETCLTGQGWTARAGKRIGSDECEDWNYIYYRPITDPLTAAMARALAAKQPEDKAG